MRSRYGGATALVAVAVLVAAMFVTGAGALQEAPGGPGGTEAASGASWTSILPPVIAILLAVAMREVVVALFVAVWSGALLLVSGNPFTALAKTIDEFVVGAIVDSSHASILVFSALLGGMVGLINRSGGTQGIVERLRPYATNSRRGQLATWAMGVLIYFDDYANTLIVGTTMQPITDRLRISREKLAYIVDSTAAPIACLIPLSTWIGFEIGLVQEAFNGLESSPGDAFATIVESIPYRFYQVFALVLGLTIAISGYDFGPMARAERRARHTGELVARDEKPLADFTGSALEPPDGAPRRAINAALPILIVIAVTLIGLWRTGTASLDGPVAHGLAGIREVFQAADSYRALLWASSGGLLVAALLAVGQRILKPAEAALAAVEGIKAMLTAFVVLILAWSLGAVCAELGTAEFLVEVSAGRLAPQLVPTLTFVLAAVISFATGTSWGTMGILTPLVIPLADSLMREGGIMPPSDAYMAVLLATIGSVLAGSTWGDHCSPISDTTVLSSMASGCDHLAHVRTQIPYALAAGAVSVVLGNLPIAFGVSPWLALVAGSAALIGLVRLLGQRIDDEPASD